MYIGTSYREVWTWYIDFTTVIQRVLVEVPKFTFPNQSFTAL